MDTSVLSLNFDSGDLLLWIVQPSHLLVNNTFFKLISKTTAEQMYEVFHITYANNSRQTKVLQFDNIADVHEYYETIINQAKTENYLMEKPDFIDFSLLNTPQQQLDFLRENTELFSIFENNRFLKSNNPFLLDDKHISGKRSLK